MTIQNDKSNYKETPAGKSFVEHVTDRGKDWVNKKVDVLVVKTMRYLQCFSQVMSLISYILISLGN